MGMARLTYISGKINYNTVKTEGKLDWWTAVFLIKFDTKYNLNTGEDL